MTADPVTVAHAHFEQVHSYRATIRSSARSGEHAEIHYAYLKPGFVRMDFVSPHHGPCSHTIRATARSGCVRSASMCRRR
jgi:outer membrane lipoprotein-sorting protein